MANTRISELQNAPIVSGTYVVPASSINSTYKISFDQLSDWINSKSIKEQIGDYAINLYDNKTIITFNNSEPVTLTIPNNTNTYLPVGTTIELIRLGSGTVNVVGDSNIIVNSSVGWTLRAIYSKATISKINNTTWVLSGDLMLGPTPTPTPSITPSATPTVTPSVTSSETPTVTPTVTPTETPTETPTATPTITSSETPTVTPSVTSSETPTATPTNTNTPTSSLINWSPNDFGSSLGLWLDANDSSTITLNGSSVSQWNDKSGNNRHATQTIAVNQPTYAIGSLNNKATVYFSQSIHTLAFSNSYSTQGQTYCLVLTREMNGNISPLYGDSNNFSYLHYLESNYWFDGKSRVVAVPMIANSWYTNISVAGAKWSNGTLFGTQGSIASSNFIQLNNGGSGNVPWRVAEIIVVNQAIDTTNRQKLEGYLAHKWGLTGNLPPNHPYKVVAP